MKKVVLILALALFLTGCSGIEHKTGDSEKIDIVCTIFPTYDWVRNIVGEYSDRFSVTLLGDGADLHSYQPTAADIAKIQTCDLLIYVGGESDFWVSDVIKGKNIRTLSLLEKLSDDLEHGTHHEEINHEHDYDEYDEHVWLSLDMAEDIVEELKEEIYKLDKTNAAEYERNAEKYEAALERLDMEYETAISQAKNKNVIFADRFPFLYMMRDYGIEYFAAFPGCSADIEASFETVAFLSEKAKELKKETLIILENSKQNIAETVIRNSNGAAENTVVMNSCQSASLNDDYIEIMKENLVSLKKALN